MRRSNTINDSTMDLLYYKLVLKVSSNPFRLFNLKDFNSINADRIVRYKLLKRLKDSGLVGFQKYRGRTVYWYKFQSLVGVRDKIFSGLDNLDRLSPTDRAAVKALISMYLVDIPFGVL